MAVITLGFKKKCLIFILDYLSIRNRVWNIVKIYRLKPEFIQIRLCSSVPPFRKDTTLRHQDKGESVIVVCGDCRCLY
jgi:hypothetical protein